MSPSSETIWERDLRNVTEQARQAAVLGLWDKVRECYRLRGMHLRDQPIPPALATDLTALDLEVAARLVNARAAVESLLIETAKVRRNLLGLRSWQGLSEKERPLMDQLA